MKKFRKIIFLILGVSLGMAIIFTSLNLCGIIVSDHSAVEMGQYIYWQGREYMPCSGDYDVGRRVATTTDGRWDISTVKQDKSLTFIEVRSFLDNYLYVDTSYPIATEGKLTSVSWKGNYIYDEEFLDAMSHIAADRKDDFTTTTDGIYALSDTQKMGQLFFAYEGCPVATLYNGYMGKMDGKLCITTYISSDTNDENHAPKEHEVRCYIIPDEYADIIEKYFEKIFK